MKPFSAIKEALKDIRRGKFVILVDDPKRENEGDFFLPAATITPAKVNFMIKHGRGLVCVALASGQARRLALPVMVPPYENTERTKVNFTVSVNAKRHITSGVSAFDRAKTIQVLANPHSKGDDLTRPGHVFPLIAHEDGLRARPGHTEAAVTLAQLAGWPLAGALCEILKDDGRMARLPDLIRVGKKFNIPLVAITDLISYVKTNPLPRVKSPSIRRTATAFLPTAYGTFKAFVYQSMIDNREHLALLLGDKRSPLLTRVHSQCLTGDTLGSLTCDCGEQLQMSLRLIQRAGHGLLLYLNQEGRGIGLTNKIKAYEKQKHGLDTVEANRVLGFAPDERNYQVAAEILHDLGVKDILLLTNNPDKIQALERQGIKVVKRLPLETAPTPINYHYLFTKKQKLGHHLNLV